MKRVVFAVVLLIFLIGFNSFCLSAVSDINERVSDKLDSLQKTIENESNEQILTECEDFTEYWLSEHHILCMIVRHELLDQTTISVSRFVPLAKYDEKGELASEINRCKLLMEEIWDSERPVPRNIF